MTAATPTHGQYRQRGYFAVGTYWRYRGPSVSGFLREFAAASLLQTFCGPEDSESDREKTCAEGQVVNVTDAPTDGR